MTLSENLRYDHQRVFQDSLDDAVRRGVAPGFQYVIFDGSSVLFNGVSGFSTLPSPAHPSGIHWKNSTVLNLASCTKLCVSLVALHIISRNLCNTGFTFDDLDDADKLAEVLPEFRPGSGSLTVKILEGLGNVGPDGKRELKLRDAKERLTLRHLLTHTAGMGYSWTHPVMNEVLVPSDGTVPNKPSATMTGSILDFDLPLLGEPGLTWRYGQATDWLALFAVRSTNKNLRQLLHEIIVQPLSIPPSEADLFFASKSPTTHASMHVRSPSSSSGFEEIPFGVWTTEDGGDPPPGKAYFAGGGLLGSCQAYATILQAVLRRDERILSREVWVEAIKDDLKDREVPVQLPKPIWDSQIPSMSCDVVEFAKSTAQEGGASVNLLQCFVATAPTKSGRPAGSFGWGGLGNTYYFVDPINNIGAIISTQLFPFFDEKLVQMRDELEALVYNTLKPRKARL
ncbi:hypothetical protein JAAARDRAFT_209310 [Jaapia argillacea MUCL 33604]|uniref:Beta-lactamase-related domain-containing protein n=1 Tax=Jaapia argillacea MUCL 33604 TaxID=933084 RepID=A0A067PTJ6_9AGAM|nr:hypothetical protein JAAARDRAFT_209310 [Jaapia argillacea MUCL 33604]